jgi:hypothetical protein
LRASCHTGGRKILETTERVLGINRARLAHSWAELRDYGNLSSASSVRAAARAPSPRSRCASAGGIRARFLGVFRRP